MKKETTVAFTGHRTSKIIASTNNPNILTDLPQLLDKAIEILINGYGYTTFLSGMSEGFDLMAAEAVLRAQKRHTHIQLVAVIPFRGQEWSYSASDKLRYKTILSAAHHIEHTSPTYHNKAFFVRNDFLVANSSTIVCYYNMGLRSGTMYTVNRAKSLNLNVINLQNSEKLSSNS